MISLPSPQTQRARVIFLNLMSLLLLYQVLFAEKAGIANVTFLSDSPDFDFGRKTGLLHPMHHILQRAVMVVDEQNVVRYIEIVPMSQLPNFAGVLTAARRVLGIRDS
jgi:thiol peroxidase